MTKELDQLKAEVDRLQKIHDTAAAEFDRKSDLPWWLGGPFIGLLYATPAWRRYQRAFADVRNKRRLLIGKLRDHAAMLRGQS